MSISKIINSPTPIETVDKINEIVELVDNNINILSTSGTIVLSDNSINSITPTGNVTFELPTITDNTIIHRILVQVNLTSIYSIDVGTDKFFDRTKADFSRIGTYNIFYEYDKAQKCWICKGTIKGTAPIEGVTKAEVTYVSLLLNENGTLFGCGRNTKGQQGDGSTTNVLTLRKIADDVVDFSATYPLAANLNCTTIGYLNASGNLYMSGDNSCGQQGDGSTTDVSVFTQRASNVKSFTSGDYSTWYIDNNNDLYGCGSNESGQQGSGTSGGNVKTFTKRASNVKFVSAYSNTACYITNSNNLYAINSSNVFALVASNVTSAFASGAGIFYIDSSANLYKYEKSSGTTTLLASNAASATIGDYSPYSYFYIDTSGNLKGKGKNEYGDLGTGNTSEVTTFTQLANNVAFVSASGWTTFYITTSGDLYGCGRNNGYQLGNGTTTDSSTFTKIASNVTYVRAGLWTTSYLTASKEVYFTGYNSYGQIGDGTTSTVTKFRKIE